MNKIYRNGLLMLAAGALTVSCADYNVTDNFTAEPDPTFVEPYKDYAPVKSYIDRSKYPNMSLGVTLNVTDYNKQELAHSAAMTNFDNLSFGTSLMSGSIINSKGLMNFVDMKDLLNHVEEIGGEVFGSPIAANASQAYEWLNTLTAPIEIPVEFVEGKAVDYTTMDKFEGTIEGNGKASITKFNGQNALKIEPLAKVHIIEGFDVDPAAKYTIIFWARVEQDASFNVYFSGKQIYGNASDGKKWSIKAGKWEKIVVEAQSAEGETEGYLKIQNTRTTPVYIQNVQVGYYPDSRRPQTEQEVKDTISYALNTWCDGLMKNNAGRIKSFDLIDEAIGSKAELENGMLDLKHSTDKIFWQDVFGSDSYAPAVSNAAIAAYQKYEGDPSELKFFISESGLDEQKKFESLKYWIDVWSANGAKIDGINAKLNLTYSEDEATQAANKASFDKMLDNLVSTGKLVRLSNFDIKYQDAEGESVTAAKITDEQRQKLADYYAYIIKSYMNKVPQQQQAGLCKGSMVDTSSSDPVGLWTIDRESKDWVRTATYKAFCDALSGK
ncbi:MAG: endo-1,4-beta-xylanase [Prevotella sp.]|nr:endo-1,4-beta-xylanase [Prevotella sp.]